MGFLDRLLAPWRAPAAPFLPPMGPLLDLPLYSDPYAQLQARRDTAGEVVREAKAAHALQEQYLLGGQFGGDPDEHTYRRISNGVRAHHRDLSPLAQERMLQVAWYLWEQNGLAKRLVTLMTDLVVGGGVTVEAEDERIQEVLDKALTGTGKYLQTKPREFHNALMITGELILPAAVNPISGGLELGYLDPMQIEAVIPTPGNVLVPMAVKLKSDRAAGGDDGKLLQVIRENPMTGLLEGEVFLKGINKLPNSFRGRSDLLPHADWLDQYDQFLLAFVEQMYLQTAFIWDYSIEGADKPTIDAKLKALGTPKPGTVFGHNEKEKLEARTPDLKASDRSNAGRMLLTHIVGTFGYPLSYFGFTDSNHATIEGQNDVMMRTPQARQQEYREFLSQIIRFAIEQATTKNPALFRDASTAFKIRMPEIQAKDISRVGQVLAQVVSAMDTAMANKTASRHLATTALTTMLGQMGLEADPNAVMEQADEEADERQEIADQIAAGVARDRSLRNPPVPDPDDPDDDEDDDPAARPADRRRAVPA
jgi:hypothetical protein